MAWARPGGCISKAVRFDSAEAAWFWACQALRARHDGASRSDRSGTLRPCDPDDVILCLERLLSSRRLGPAQVRVLATWGRRQIAPSAWLQGNEEAMLWREGMEALAKALFAKNIIAEPTLGN